MSEGTPRGTAVSDKKKIFEDFNDLNYTSRERCFGFIGKVEGRRTFDTWKEEKTTITDPFPTTECVLYTILTNKKEKKEKFESGGHPVPIIKVLFPTQNRTPCLSFTGTQVVHLPTDVSDEVFNPSPRNLNTRNYSCEGTLSCKNSTTNSNVKWSRTGGSRSFTLLRKKR